MQFQKEKHFELYSSRICYDPKFGVVETIDDFTREHCASIEDHLMNYINNPQVYFIYFNKGFY